MTAVISVRVYTGTNAVTESAAVTGIDWISADNATNSPTNRSTYPVFAGQNSYEKHIRLHVDTAPATQVTNFLFWMSTTPVANVALRAKLAVGSGGASPGGGDTTPTATAMSGDADAYGYTASSKGQWDAAAYSAQNQVTKALLLQLQPNASALTQDIAQQRCNYSYDES